MTCDTSASNPILSMTSTTLVADTHHSIFKATFPRSSRKAWPWPFKLICDDFRYRNILVNATDLTIALCSIENGLTCTMPNALFTPRWLIFRALPSHPFYLAISITLSKICSDIRGEQEVTRCSFSSIRGQKDVESYATFHGRWKILVEETYLFLLPIWR